MTCGRDVEIIIILAFLLERHLRWVKTKCRLNVYAFTEAESTWSAGFVRSNVNGPLNLGRLFVARHVGYLTIQRHN